MLWAVWYRLDQAFRRALAHRLAPPPTNGNSKSSLNGHSAISCSNKIWIRSPLGGTTAMHALTASWLPCISAQPSRCFCCAPSDAVPSFLAYEFKFADHKGAVAWIWVKLLGCVHAHTSQRMSTTLGFCLYVILQAKNELQNRLWNKHTTCTNRSSISGPSGCNEGCFEALERCYLRIWGRQEKDQPRIAYTPCTCT